MVGKAETRHYTNNSLQSAYQRSILNAAVNAAKSGKDHKEGFKNFKNFLKTRLPAKGGWDLKEFKKDDFEDLRNTSSNPKKGDTWQFQHDILADLHSAQGDKFELKRGGEGGWVNDMFQKKGFAMNAPFSGGVRPGTTVEFAKSPFQTIPVGNIGISGFLRQGSGTGQVGWPTGGDQIMNTGSFYDLAINPETRRGHRQGFGLGGYTVMQ